MTTRRHDVALRLSQPHQHWDLRLSLCLETYRESDGQLMKRMRGHACSTSFRAAAECARICAGGDGRPTRMRLGIAVLSSVAGHLAERLRLTSVVIEALVRVLRLRAPAPQPTLAGVHAILLARAHFACHGFRLVTIPAAARRLGPSSWIRIALQAPIDPSGRSLITSISLVALYETSCRVDIESGQFRISGQGDGMGGHRVLPLEHIRAAIPGPPHTEFASQLGYAS